jgi:uncharacterized protein
VTNHDFNMAIVDEVAHRPWPMPDRPWVMTQTWNDLLFAHWPIDRHQLRLRVPPAFEVDLFGGEAWIGIVPFRMTNVAPRAIPSVPWLSEFSELNVRTYVRLDDRPGVYFFSLDAESALAVRAARTLLNLPYHTATIEVSTRANRVAYRSIRDSNPAAEFAADYEPTGLRFVANEGSLEYFLTERYCLYHVDHHGAPYRLDIHHPPWRLQLADATLARNRMAEINNLRLSGQAPVLHFSKRQDMIAWPPCGLARKDG